MREAPDVLPDERPETSASRSHRPPARPSLGPAQRCRAPPNPRRPIQRSVVRAQQVREQQSIRFATQRNEGGTGTQPNPAKGDCSLASLLGNLIAVSPVLGIHRPEERGDGPIDPRIWG